jgi:hypothetical protein
VKEIFANYGINEEVQDKIVDELSKDKAICRLYDAV